MATYRNARDSEGRLNIIVSVHGQPVATAVRVERGWLVRDERTGEETPRRTEPAAMRALAILALNPTPPNREE